MFLQPPKKTITPHHQPLSKLKNILSAEQLLSSPKFQSKLHDIEKTSQFEKAHYQHLALHLIHQVAFTCQHLPEGTVYFSYPGGLLEHVLSRTVAATTLLRQYLLPPPESGLSDEQKRWWYTLFSASLLRGLGALCVDYRINHYSINGQFLKTWEPLFEPIGQLNHHYDHEFKTFEDPMFKKRLTLLLAKRLMPEEGFAWIASHQHVFAIWLALLEEDSDGARALGAILDRADAVVIQEALQQECVRLLQPRKQAARHISTFVDIQPESTLEKERLPGLEFMQWIQQQLERGRFILNRAPIYHVPGGILICSEAFELFSREYESTKNRSWQMVQQSLVSLKLHQTGPEGMAIAKYDQGNGIVIQSSIALPEHLSYKNIKTGEVLNVAATALSLGETGVHISPQGDFILEQQSPRAYLSPKGNPHG